MDRLAVVDDCLAFLLFSFSLPETLQTIAFFAWLKEARNLSGPHLVIVPLNVLDTWVAEVAHWCLSFRVVRYHGSEKARQRIHTEYVAPRLYDILVTTYETAVVASRYLSTQQFCYVAIDEAHRCKNPQSKISTVMRDYFLRHVSAAAAAALE